MTTNQSKRLFKAKASIRLALAIFVLNPLCSQCKALDSKIPVKLTIVAPDNLSKEITKAFEEELDAIKDVEIVHQGELFEIVALFQQTKSHDGATDQYLECSTVVMDTRVEGILSYLHATGKLSQDQLDIVKRMVANLGHISGHFVEDDQSHNLKPLVHRIVLKINDYTFTPWRKDVLDVHNAAKNMHHYDQSYPVASPSK